MDGGDLEQACRVTGKDGSAFHNGSRRDGHQAPYSAASPSTSTNVPSARKKRHSKHKFRRQPAEYGHLCLPCNSTFLLDTNLNHHHQYAQCVRGRAAVEEPAAAASAPTNNAPTLENEDEDSLDDLEPSTWRESSLYSDVALHRGKTLYQHVKRYNSRPEDPKRANSHPEDLKRDISPNNLRVNDPSEAAAGPGMCQENTCDQCQETLPSSDELRRHRRGHKNKGTGCIYCDRYYATTHLLKSHMQSSHTLAYHAATSAQANTRTANEENVPASPVSRKIVTPTVLPPAQVATPLANEDNVSELPVSRKNYTTIMLTPASPPSSDEEETPAPGIGEAPGAMFTDEGGASCSRDGYDQTTL